MDIESLLPQLKELFGRYEVCLAYLFGSQAEGQARPYSDVDIAVLLRPEVPQKRWTERQIELLGELMSLLRRNDVDLVLLNQATPLLAYQVVKYGKVIYEDGSLSATDFAARTLSLYADTAHLRRLKREYLKEWIEERKADKMVKAETIIELLDSLKEMIGHLRQVQTLSLAELLADRLRYSGVLHYLQLAVQHVTDIGAHLLAGTGYALPEDYRQIILEMGHNGIIPDEFAKQVAPMAGFRNILVHEYLTVDPEIVYEYLQYRLADFERFIEYIYNFLEREGYLN